MKLLVIEDDPQTAAFVKSGLEERGHVVDAVADGREGLFLAAGSEYEIMIVDRMLPGIDGLAIIQTIRAAGVRTPALVLSALDRIDDRVAGLEAGADDYLGKPFAFAELIARVKALARRPPLVETQTVLRVADLEMDLLKQATTRAGRRIDLQPREFRVLVYLMRHADQVVTRTMLLEHVWDFHFDPRTSMVETHISRLRSKIDKGFTVQLIHTVRGAGYCLRAPA